MNIYVILVIQLFLLGFLVVFNQFLYLYGMKYSTAANGQPIVATILSVIFLNTAITIQFVVGGVVTMTGVIITQQK